MGERYSGRGWGVLKRCHGEITAIEWLKKERDRGIRGKRVREKDEGKGRV